MQAYNSDDNSMSSKPYPSTDLILCGCFCMHMKGACPGGLNTVGVPPDFAPLPAFTLVC
jgi:hypothetical protein